MEQVSVEPDEKQYVYQLSIVIQRLLYCEC